MQTDDPSSHVPAPAPGGEPETPEAAPVAPHEDARPSMEPAPVPPHEAAMPAPSPLADGTARRLDPAFVPYERLGGWITVAFVFAAGPIGIGIFWVASEARIAVIALVTVLWLAIVVLLVVTTWVMPQRRYDRYRWILSPAGLEIRHGVVFRTITSVPRARVQHTDVAQGPIQRRFGLASLVIHTAGQQDSEIHLPGITFDTARAIRDDLMAAGAGDGS